MGAAASAEKRLLRCDASSRCDQCRARPSLVDASARPGHRGRAGPVEVGGPSVAARNLADLDDDPLPEELEDGAARLVLRNAAPDFDEAACVGHRLPEIEEPPAANQQLEAVAGLLNVGKASGRDIRHRYTRQLD